MTAHPDVETLSTYLDRELSLREKARVEEHLEQCEDCRQHLTGLRRVIGNLQTLERLAPPPHLGTHLHRLAALQASQPTLAERLEHGMSRFNFQSVLAPVFAVVVALILIIYMLSWGIYRQNTGRIPVHLEAEQTWAEERPGTTSRSVAGRVFHLVDEVWLEDGLDRAVTVEPISVVDPRVQDWFSQFPELEEIAGLGDRVRLVVAGQVVEIRFDEP